MHGIISFLIAVSLVSGCTAAYSSAPLPTTHPASSAAPEAPPPPNSIPMRGGPGPFDYITMGGLFTVLKVHENLKRYDRDPGWYRHPQGTVATLASRKELQRDGITG